MPSNALIDKWRSAGGDALGCLLVISDEDAHRDLIFKRGEITKKGSEKQQLAFDRCGPNLQTIKLALINISPSNELHSPIT